MSPLSPWGHVAADHFDIRGRDERLIAQMYFPDDAPANAQPHRFSKELGDDAPTSLALALAVAVVGAGRYRWYIVLMDGQGHPTPSCSPLKR